MFDSLPCENAPHDVALLVVQLRRDDHRDRLSDRLLLRVSEHSLGSGIPRGNHIVDSLGDDRVVCGLHDRCIQRLDLVSWLEVDGIRGHRVHAWFILFHTHLTCSGYQAEILVCSAHTSLSASSSFVYGTGYTQRISTSRASSLHICSS